MNDLTIEEFRKKLRVFPFGRVLNHNFQFERRNTSYTMFFLYLAMILFIMNLGWATWVSFLIVLILMIRKFHAFQKIDYLQKKGIAFLIDFKNGYTLERVECWGLISKINDIQYLIELVKPIKIQIDNQFFRVDKFYIKSFRNYDEIITEFRESNDFFKPNFLEVKLVLKFNSFVLDNYNFADHRTLGENIVWNSNNALIPYFDNLNEFQISPIISKFKYEELIFIPKPNLIYSEVDMGCFFDFGDKDFEEKCDQCGVCSPEEIEKKKEDWKKKGNN